MSHPHKLNQISKYPPRLSCGKYRSRQFRAEILRVVRQHLSQKSVHGGLRIVQLDSIESQLAKIISLCARVNRCHEIRVESACQKKLVNSFMCEFDFVD